MITGCPAGCGLSGGCSVCCPSIQYPQLGHHGFIPSIPQMGWVCSKCSRSYAPTTAECWSCNTLINSGLVKIGGTLNGDSK